MLTKRADREARLKALEESIATMAGAGAGGVPGPKGDKGDTGTPGVQGIPGAQGAPGEQGIQGIPGVGSIGLKGDKGDKGDTGTQGIQGIQGIQGVAGTNATAPAQRRGTITLPALSTTAVSVTIAFASAFADTNYALSSLVPATGTAAAFVELRWTLDSTANAKAAGSIKVWVRASAAVAAGTVAHYHAIHD